MKLNFYVLYKISALYCLLVVVNCTEHNKENEKQEKIEGLKISTLKEAPSCDRKAKNGDQLTVHYDGFLENGKEFDSSRKRNQPFVITLGKGMVIPGWEKGLIGTCEGEQRRLEIAPELAYGDQGFGDVIPPRSTLIFHIELLKLEAGTVEPEGSDEDVDEATIGEALGFTDEMFSEMDTDDDKHINVEELANYMIKHEGRSKHADSFDIYTAAGEIFQEEDKNKDGLLSYDELVTQPGKHDEL